MCRINNEYLEKCIATLEKSYDFLKLSEEGSVEYEIYRNSLVKSFEITLEQSGKFLKKKLEPFFCTKKELDKLTFKDIFRYANKHDFLTSEEVERWFLYRDNRNDTAHDYGENLAEETVALCENLIKDAKNLLEIL